MRLYFYSLSNTSFQEPFLPEKVLEWADQILDALEYLHAQQPPIVHRDIKPQNLKLTEDGRIILLDFGLAKGTFGFNTSLVTSKSVLGFTPNFAPLEQIQGTGTETRSDLYSLAATLYFLLPNVVPSDALSRASNIVGELPDPLRPADEVNPQVLSQVAAVLRRAMALHPNQRFANAAEMRLMLRNASQSQMASNSELKETILSPTQFSPAPTIQVQKEISENTLTETQQLDFEYWVTFRDFLNQHSSFLKLQKPKPEPSISFPIGRKGFILRANISRKGRRLDVFLKIFGKDCIPHYNLLIKDAKNIEREIGAQLNWRWLKTENYGRIRLSKNQSDPANRQNWQEQHEWLREKLELFHKVFEPRIQILQVDYKPIEFKKVQEGSLRWTESGSSTQEVQNRESELPPSTIASPQMNHAEKIGLPVTDEKPVGRFVFVQPMLGKAHIDPRLQSSPKSNKSKLFLVLGIVAVIVLSLLIRSCS